MSFNDAEEPIEDILSNTVYTVTAFDTLASQLL